ncbi:MAG: hypothetical protein DRO18_08490 [Thermoprotei archaeon]|nr:MAG: hypothetical protein DRO18_08490 [Thermoprotei archaeon]HDN75717.1 aminotransferase class V-fold PLP-dependent enzyme [Acidilobales archaeon]
MPILVSIQFVNHEIDIIQRLKGLVKIAKNVNPDVILHTDTTDAYIKLGVNVKSLNADLSTISNHKILGPRRVDILYVKERIKGSITWVVKYGIIMARCGGYSSYSRV